MSRLTRIGTVHRGPGGLTALVENLARLGPHIIPLEFSAYGLRYRLEKKKTSHAQIVERLT